MINKLSIIYLNELYPTLKQHLQYKHNMLIKMINIYVLFWNFPIKMLIKSGIRKLIKK